MSFIRSGMSLELSTKRSNSTVLGITLAQLGAIMVALSATLFAFMGIQLVTADFATIADTVPDDAYYYVLPAFHFAKTGFISFDGINATNGFHPLWFWICSLLARMSTDKEMLMRLVIATSYAFTGLVPFVLGNLKCFKDAGLRKAIFISILLSLGSTRFIASQALEVGVYAFFLSLLLVQLESLFDADGAVSRRNLILFAVTLGISILARLDCVLLFGLAFIALSIYRKRLFLDLKSLILVAAIVTAIVSTWLIFCYFTVHFISQDSSNVKRMWIEYERDRFGLLRLRNFKHGLSLVILSPVQMALASLSFLIPMVILIGLKMKELKSLVTGDMMKRMTLPLLLLTCAGIQGVISRYFSADQFLWYMTPGCIIWAMLAAYLVSQIKVNFSQARIMVGVIAVALVAQFGQMIAKHQGYWGQSTYITMIHSAEEMIPEGAVIGSWNSGVFAFHSSHRVVNLDGLINHQVLEFYRTKTYERCFEALGVDYVFDWEETGETPQSFIGKPRAIYFASKPLPLEKIKEYPAGKVRFVLYKVIKEAKVATKF